MPKSTTPSIASRKAYEKFLRSVRLYSIALDQTEVKLEREAYWEHINDEELNRIIRASYSVEGLSGDHFDVIAEFALSVEHGKTKAALLVIICKFSAHFHASAECEAKLSERFAKSEARIILWPYFREFVSNITARLNVPPVTIPMVLDQS